MVPGDMCLGMENIGFQFFEQKGDWMCKEFGGVGTFRSCTYSLQYDLEIVIDFEKVYASYIGPRCSLNDDPTGQITDTLKASLDNFTSAFVNSTMSGDTGGIVFKSA